MDIRTSSELQAYLDAPGISATTRRHIEREPKFLSPASRASKNRIVIHDLRFEHDGRVTQIDHLVLNSVLEVWQAVDKR